MDRVVPGPVERCERLLREPRLLVDVLREGRDLRLAQGARRRPELLVKVLQREEVELRVGAI